MNLTHTAVLILAFVLRLYIEKIEAFCRGWGKPSPYEYISYYSNDGQGQAQPLRMYFLLWQRWAGASPALYEYISYYGNDGQGQAQPLLFISHFRCEPAAGGNPL